MAIKRYTCRTHQGGIFTKEATRGRQPVRCREEFPCDKADQPIKASAGSVSSENTYSAAEKREAINVPDFDSMSNAELKAYARKHFSTIGKITSREQMIRALKAQHAKQATPEQVAAAVAHIEAPQSEPEPQTVANDSLPLAMRAKERLAAVGWVVKGRAWIETNDGAHRAVGMAEVTASREAETLIITWRDGVLVAQQYGMESLKPSENGYPDSELHFKPDELTDSELVRMVRGMKVTWWNTIAASKESAIVGGNVTIEHIFYASGDEDNSKRIIKFVDRNAGGFRAFHVGAMLKVG